MARTTGVRTIFTLIATGIAASLTVDVTAIEVQLGAIMLADYDAEGASNGSGPSVKTARIDVTGAEVSVTLDDLPPGRYAIKLYHDANGNGEHDTNMVGLPIEAYGFSGDGVHVGSPLFGVATFDVVVGENNAVAVRLR